jgi:hypothetical protein
LLPHRIADLYRVFHPRDGSQELRLLRRRRHPISGPRNAPTHQNLIPLHSLMLMIAVVLNYLGEIWHAGTLAAIVATRQIWQLPLACAPARPDERTDWRRSSSAGHGDTRELRGRP